MPQLIGEPPGRITPVGELVNTLEVEAMAQRQLNSLTYAEISGSDRRPFDRITFRPRMMVNTTKLNLTLDLFGVSMFAPIIAGPIADQKRFHPEGEAASARGAAQAKAVIVVSEKSSCPIEQIASEAKAGFWYQVFPEFDKEKLRAAIGAGCKALCITLSDQAADWKAIDAVRQGDKMPVLLKGIMNAEDATAAVKHGVQAIVASNYVGSNVTGLASPMEVLPGIVEAVGGKIPVLIDGSFRRGSDILMALALGAKAVLVARPVVWGLAAYGSDGARQVLELLQTELARDMAMCGKVDLKAIDRSTVRVHKW
ncbi:MAG TPA: alpha-hydroxy-acid oxidizing protein [Bryobacteraceae bacterium]|nr:alpha-hydroxy-acid oxidizing protein [Bryobacteraceae bacterium]